MQGIKIVNIVKYTTIIKHICMEWEKEKSSGACMPKGSWGFLITTFLPSFETDIAGGQDDSSEGDGEDAGTWWKNGGTESR